MSEAETIVAKHESHIPDAVQKQMDEINAIHKANAQPTAEQATEQGNTEQTALVNDENTVTPAPDDSFATPLSAPAEEPIKDEPLPTTTDISTLPEDIQKRLRAYDVLKGKYSKEVPDLTLKLRKAEARVELLSEELEEAQQAKPVAHTFAAPTHMVTPDDISDDDLINAGISEQNIEDYGEDFWKQQVAMQRNMQLPLLQKVEEVRATATPEQRQRDEETFYTSLDSLTPNWREHNNSRAFAHFLDTTDPIYGVQYGDMLQDAASDNDAIRVSAIYALYEQQLSQNAPKVPSPSMPVAQSVNLPSVQSQVAPHSVPQGHSNGKKMYALSEWKQMMINLTNGEYTPERAAAIQKELEAAVSEKRIIPN